MPNWWRNHKKTAQDLLLALLLLGLALVLRLPRLNVFLTADEPKSWFGRSIQFLQAIAQQDWLGTFDSPAPGVTTMWAGSLGLMLDYARQGYPGDLLSYLNAVPFDPLDPAILPLIRLPGVLIGALAVVLTFWWGRLVFGRAAAVMAAAFLALDPFSLALTRILGHDALVTIFMWLSLLAFLRAKRWHRPGDVAGSSPQNHIASPNIPDSLPKSGTRPFSRPYLIVSGICGGLAFLTKYPSLFLGAFLALSMLIIHIRDWRLGSEDEGRSGPGHNFGASLKSRHFWKQVPLLWIGDVLLWSIAAGLIGLILWPAMWVDPLGHVSLIINDALRASGSPHQKGSFFLGQPVPDPGPSYYVIVTAFKSTFVFWLGWILAIWTGWRQRGQRWPKIALLLLAFVLAYALLVSVGGKKQDRYILPIFPALATLAALGYAQFTALKIGKTVWRNGLLTALILLQAVLIIPYAPYYFNFYNPLIGGGQSASQNIIIGWGEGLDEAARWLNTLPGHSDLQVVAWYSTTFEPYFEGQAIYKIDEEKISRSPKPGLAADYVVFYVNQLQRQIPSEGALQHFQAVEPVHVVRLNGTDYAWIYPSISMQRVMANEARLIGQAELQGFNIRNEDGRLIDHLVSNGSQLLELYWEWQGKAEDEPIGLKLVDDQGRTWGWGHPLGTKARLPFDQWQDGMVAYDSFALNVFPGTPPGIYYLSSWIDRPATGEVVGTFPLEASSVQLAVDRASQPPAPAELNLSQTLNLDILPEIRFLGLQDELSSTDIWMPGQSLDLMLYWQALDDIDENYPVTLSLIDSMDQTQAAWTNVPGGGYFSSDLWQKDDIIRDPWTLTFPPYLPPGSYNLSLNIGPSSETSLGELGLGGRNREFTQPTLDLTLTHQFGDSLVLQGLQGPIENEGLLVTPGQALDITLIWQAIDLTPEDYVLTVQVLDEQSQVLAQQDTVPLDGQAPTTSWTPGEFIEQAVFLEFAAEASPKQLLVAFYHPESGERLTLEAGSDHLIIPLIQANSGS